MRKAYYISVLIVLFTLGVVAQGQNKWSLKTSKDGMQVYTARIGNASFKAVRVECTLPGTASQLLAVLFDVDKHPQWVYSTKTTTLLRRLNSNGELTYYALVSTPWPFSNRDFIAQTRVTQPSDNVVILDSHVLPDFVPEKSGVVRIKTSTAHWVITKLSPNSIHVEYTVQFDPGGNIPAWLTNMFETEGPVESFKKMRERITMPAYKNAHFDFVKE
jgi:hypothetical protein